MVGSKFKYDVAFSFLAQDEPLAMQLNDRLQDRVKTFIYSEQQKALAGTDGEKTFHRVFGEEARLVVVLYRKGWGEKTWTQIEQTAIRKRGFDEGYDFAKFIPLDDPPVVPKWLPPTQLWIGIKRFGIDAAAAVIEARVQELGGQPHEETVEERAQRTERQMRFDALREKFQWEVGVQAAQQEFAKLKDALEERALSVRKASPAIQLAVVQDWGTVYVLGLGCALGLTWKQETANHLRNAFLGAVLYNHKPAGPGQFSFERPEAVRSMRFTFDLLPSEVGGWIANDAQRRTFSTDALADYLTKFYLEHGRN